MPLPLWLALSTPGNGSQQSSEDLLAQPFPAAGQFPSTAGAPVSQLEQRLTSLMLHQLFAFSLVEFPKNHAAGGMRSLAPGCSALSLQQVLLSRGTSTALGDVDRALSVPSTRGCPSARLEALAHVYCLAPTLSRNAEHAAVEGGRPGAKSWPPALQREGREEDVAPGPACSEKCNLGRDLRHRGPLMAQNFLCIAAGRRRQQAQPSAEAARERGMY